MTIATVRSFSLVSTAVSAGSSLMRFPLSTFGHDRRAIASSLRRARTSGRAGTGLRRNLRAFPSAEASACSTSRAPGVSRSATRGSLSSIAFWRREQKDDLPAQAADQFAQLRVGGRIAGYGESVSQGTRSRGAGLPVPRGPFAGSPPSLRGRKRASLRGETMRFRAHDAQTPARPVGSRAPRLSPFPRPEPPRDPQVPQAAARFRAAYPPALFR